MHFIVLFLLHLSLQHLAEIRFLRNWEMESEFAMRAVCLAARGAHSLHSNAWSFFARTSKPFSPPTPPLYPFLTFHFPICVCRWCHQCPRLAGVCCLFLSVVLPQPNLGTRAASPVSQARATHMRMLRGGSCCHCSYFLPSNSLVVVEFGLLLTRHWRTALTLPLAKRALDSPRWPWRFPHGILVVLGPRTMQALAGFTDTTPVIQVRICTDLCGFRIHIPDTHCLSKSLRSSRVKTILVQDAEFWLWCN